MKKVIVCSCVLFSLMSCLCLSCSTTPQVKNAADTSVSTNSGIQDNQGNASNVEVSVNPEVKKKLDDLMDNVVFIGQTQAVLKNNAPVYVYFKDEFKKNDYDLLYDLVILYPSSDWTNEDVYKKFKAGLQFDIDRITGIMAEILLDNYQRVSYDPAIIVDGLSQINGEEALEFSMGEISENYRFDYGPNGKSRYLKKRDNFSTLYRMAVSKSGKVYVYQAKPVQIAEIKDIEGFSEEQPQTKNIKLYIPSETGHHLYYDVTEYAYYWMPRLMLDAQERVDPVMLNVTPIICESRKNYSDSLVTQTLNAGFGEYELSVNPKLDCVFENAIWVEDIIEFNGQKAYLINHGETHARNDSNNDEDSEAREPTELEFKMLSKYLLTQDGKVFVYNYEPVYVGTLEDIEKIVSVNNQISPLFVMDNPDKGFLRGVVHHYGDSKKTINFTVSTTSKNCRYAFYCFYKRDDRFEYIDELSIDAIEDYILNNYIYPTNDMIKTRNNSWEIYFSENIQYQNEDAYNIYVGLQKRNNSDKFMVMTRFIITKSGKIYQIDRSGQFVLKGQIDHT